MFCEMPWPVFSSPGPTGRGDPGQAQRSSWIYEVGHKMRTRSTCEVPVSEHVGQTEGLVVGLRVEVQEVRDVNVGQTEGLVLVISLVTVTVVEDLDPVARNRSERREPRK